jgi:hypothetical protein
LLKENKRKSHWELGLEIEELKKRKNRDLEDIKRLKVEIHKMETLYKKYKDLMAQGGFGAGQSLLSSFSVANALPFSFSTPNNQDPAETAQWLSTEELLIETAKIKNILQKEMFNRKRQ